jgi:hypothetical protein
MDILSWSIQGLYHAIEPVRRTLSKPDPDAKGRLRPHHDTSSFTDFSCTLSGPA